MTTSTPVLSVVIPTRNRPPSVLRLLHTLAREPEARDIEVTVIADGCTERTGDAVRAVTWPFPLRMLERSPGCGAASTRNLGARQSRGPVLLFIDDDMEPFPGALTAHRALHDGAPRVVIGAPRPLRPPPHDFDAIAGWGWWEQQFERMRRPGYRFGFEDVFTGILSLPAELFAAVGGFDEAMPGACREDFELGLRLVRHGAEFAFTEAGGGWHHEPRLTARLHERKRAEGAADVHLARRHPDIWPALRLSHDPRASRAMSAIRAIALRHGRLGEFVIPAVLRPLTALARWARARRRWQHLHGAALYFWYWRGVAKKLDAPDELAALAESAARAGGTSHFLEVDLRDGLDAVEAQLDAERPDALRIRWDGWHIGTLDAEPGRERLRGAHLRPLLAWPFASEMRSALARRALGGGIPDESPVPAATVVGGRPGARVAGVSVVIPAWNAEATLGEALDSLLAQTMPSWEAIVIDDGSTDGTFRVAAQYAAADPRIRVVRQAQQGGAPRARNRGLELARHDWILFLDSDDWVLPPLLQRLAEVLEAEPDVDAAVCGWSLWRDGHTVESEYCRSAGDLFPILARRPAFPIHSCLVRLARVRDVGGFDPAYRIEQDWVLWQRLARRGVHFAVVHDPLAVYRQRPGSLTSDQHAVARGARAVIALGHGPDPVVSTPDPVHAAGRPSFERTDADLMHVCWPAGILMARGEDPLPLLEGATPGVARGAAEHVGAIIARAAASAVPPAAGGWDTTWPRLERHLPALLDALARLANDPDLPGTARVAIERHALEALPAGRALTVMRSVRIDITQPIACVHVEPGIDRLLVHVAIGDDGIGRVELPVTEGRVSAPVLSDAIARACAWEILCAFFRRTVYGHWEWRRSDEGWDAWDGDRRRAAGLPDEMEARWRALHDAAGWEVLMEAVRTGPPPDTAAPASPPQSDGHQWVFVDARATPVDDPLSGSHAVLRVAGLIATVLPIPRSPIAHRDLQQALLDAMGFELAQLVVREALLGQPLEGPSLAERLDARARERLAHSRTVEPTPGTDVLVPGSEPALAEWCASGARHVGARSQPVHARHAAAHRAMVPRAAAGEARSLAAATGLPVIPLSPDDGTAGMLAVEPALHWVAPAREREEAGEPRDATPAGATRYDRHYFEQLFAKGENPWRYESEYERVKYAQTLEFLGETEGRRALEVGCAEGHFTARLAPRVGSLHAVDVSDLALARAARRAGSSGTLTLQRLDLSREPLPAGFDLVVCSEMLYFMGDRPALERAVASLAGALVPGGILVHAHAHVLADDPDRTGFDWDVPYGGRTIGEVIAAHPELALERELVTPLYRLQRYRRLPAGAPRPSPDRREQPNAVVPERPVYDRIRWDGAGSSPLAPAPLVTARLPILMYHRVADGASPSRARYAVPPRAFEEQVAYLHEAGFRTATPDEWREAARVRRPLPGRRIMLTFDDGFADFGDVAWPILRRAGFDATVFVVTGRVGQVNDWDPDADHEPLLDWPALRALARDGVRIGSHTRGHPRLTSLPHDATIRELAASRRTLVEELGQPVDTIAYPWGGEDPVVHHWAGACGYDFGFTTRPHLAHATDAMLALPRLEVRGDQSLTAFIAMLDA